MAQPTTYNRLFSFTSYQAANPTASLPATSVDGEFNRIKVTLDQILANLALIQRDDTALANNSVGLDQLKAEVSTGLEPPTLWATATNYVANDTVFANSYYFYRCVTSHTSGTFATDLAAGKWVLVATFIETKLASIAALDMAADQGVYFSDASTAQAYSLTSTGRALAALSSTGIPAITSLGAATTRTLTGTTGEIAVTNGTGAAGNPTFSLPTSLSFAGKTVDQGTFQDSILTGSPTAPTVANTTTNTNIATTAFVKSVRLDQFAAPNTSLSMATQKITNLVDPASAQDAATKYYVDSTVQGLNPKASCDAATIANIVLSGEQTIDGILTSASRVLVKNQTAPAENGIYVSAAGAWTRATDADIWDELPSAFTFVSAGTVNANTGWVCTSLTGGTLNTTAVTFTQFSGAGTYTAGTNLSLVGSVFSVATSPSFTTPNINVATATSINKMAITAPATGSTLAVADQKTFTASKSLTLDGTDATVMTFPPVSGAVLTADSTNTLTGKTFDTAGVGNSLLIGGLAMTANTGTGAIARAAGPTFTAPTLGAATATSINKMAITAPATSSTLAVADGKTLTASNTLTLAGTDATVMTFPGASGSVLTADSTNTLTNKTLTSPTINGGTLGGLTGFALRDTSAAFDVALAAVSSVVLTAGRTLTLDVQNAARTVSLAGNLAFGGGFITSGAFATTLTMTGATNLTLPTSGTLSTLAGIETLLNKTLTSPSLTTPTLGVATATSINKMAITAPATSSTLAVADGKTLTASNTLTLAGTDATVMTFPGATDTLAGLGAIQTFTAAKTFNSGKLILAGATSGTTTLNSGAIAGASVLTLPIATDTLVGKATTDVLTNKTFDTAGVGNSFSINGTAISAVTGTGAAVLAADPALTGNPTAPTQTAGNNSTRIASTAFVTAAVTASTAGVASLGAQTGIITLDGGNLASTVLTVPRYDAAQSLTAAQKAQARANTHAAPLDALAYNGMQLNGGIDVSQELGTTGATLVSGNGKYIADMWEATYVHGAATAVVTSAQIAAASFPGTPPGGYSFGLQLATTTAISSPANGDFALVRTKIEGYRVARLAWGTANAQSLAYAFQFYSTVSGVAFIRFSNGAGNRYHYKEITVAAGWNFFNGTIAGDTSGTWEKTTSAGLVIEIFSAGTATVPATPGSWGATGVAQTTNSTNLLGTANNLTIVTGLIVLPGIEMPTSDRAALIMRPFDDELLKCMRYYQTSYAYGTAPGAITEVGAVARLLDATTSYASLSVRFQPRMRITPTVTWRSVSDGSSGVFSINSGNTSAIANSGQNGPGGAIANVNNGSVVATDNLRAHFVADARM